MNNLSFESMKNLVGNLDKQRFGEVTYSIPTNPECWGNDCSEEDALRASRIVSDGIRKAFPDVSIRFVSDTMGFGNRATGPAELIEEIDDYQEKNWIDWMNQAENARWN
jgi:hypothetical protein